MPTVISIPNPVYRIDDLSVDQPPIASVDFSTETVILGKAAPDTKPVILVFMSGSRSVIANT